MVRLNFYRLLIFSCLIMFLSACARFQQPILNEGSMVNIKPKKTTLSDIIRLFSIPDIIVCDSNTTIIPDNSILSDTIKIKNQFPDNYFTYINEYIESRKNYLLSENHMVLIYFDMFYYGEHGGSVGGVWWLNKTTEKHIERIAGNELVVFINKENGIVEDYAYRKEWNWGEHHTVTKMIVKRVDRSAFFSESKIQKFWAEKYCNNIK